MKGRKLVDEPQIPDVVRDETATVPRGECGYWILFTDEEMEILPTGVCPAEIARKAWENLGWKREYARNQAREMAS